MQLGRAAQLAAVGQPPWARSDMISLRDRIEIHTTPRRLFKWLCRLPEVYTAWHPDHVACQVLHGSLSELGSEIECKEYLHGTLHSMRLRVTKSVPDKRIEYAIKGMGRGAFEAEIMGDKVGFIAELDIGSDAPVIGRLFDLVFPRVFRNRIEAMKHHMAEEGQNLKTILESGAFRLADQDAA